MLAHDEVQIGVIGHAVAFVGRALDFDHAAARVPAPPHVAGHVREQQEMINGMPDWSFGEEEARRQSAPPARPARQAPRTQPQRHMTHRSRFLPNATATAARPGEIRGRIARPASSSNEVIEDEAMLEQVAPPGKQRPEPQRDAARRDAMFTSAANARYRKRARRLSRGTGDRGPHGHVSRRRLGYRRHADRQRAAPPARARRRERRLRRQTSRTFIPRRFAAFMPSTYGRR